MSSFAALFQVRPTSIVVVIFVALICHRVAADETGAASGLQASVISALKLNTITRSTDAFLESVHYGTLAAKKAWLPQVVANCAADLNSGKTTYLNANPESSRLGYLTKSCAVYGSLTLFDSGANRANYRAQKAEEEATRNAFNTSDSLLTYTRGGVANDVIDAYLALSGNRVDLSFLRSVSEILEKFKKFSQEPVVESEIQDVNATIDDNIAVERASRERFKFLVKTEPAAELESLEATIQGLKIPATAGAAKAIAVASGPEVLRRRAEVESASWRLNETKALYGPKITMDVGLSALRYSDQINNQSSYATANRSARVTLTVPLLNTGSRDRVNAAKSYLNSKNLERDAAIERATYTIQATYDQLGIHRRAYEIAKRNYATQLAVLKDIIAKIDANDTASLDVTNILSSLSTLRQRQEAIVFRQKAIILNLFAVEQMTGLLFTTYAPQNAGQ